jgi:hypothetical protein
MKTEGDMVSLQCEAPVAEMLGFQTYTAKSVRHENNGSKGKERNEAGDAEGEYFCILILNRW